MLGEGLQTLSGETVTIVLPQLVWDKLVWEGLREFLEMEPVGPGNGLDVASGEVVLVPE